MHHVTDQLLRKFPSLFVLISPLSPHAPCMWPFPQPHPKPRTFSLGTKACPRIPLTPWQWSGPRAAPHWAPSEAHVLKATASKGSRVRGPSRTWFNPPVPFASQCPLTFPLFNPHFPRDMRISMMPPPLPNNLMCPLPLLPNIQITLWATWPSLQSSFSQGVYLCSNYWNTGR